MSSSESTYGDIHRYEPARESTAAAIAIVLLTVIEVVFVDLAFILMLYRKEFLPDVMIVKKRRRKWEDLYISQDQMEGTTLSDGMLDGVKRAVYPYYKR